MEVPLMKFKNYNQLMTKYDDLTLREDFIRKQKTLTLVHYKTSKKYRFTQHKLEGEIFDNKTRFAISLEFLREP